MELQATIGALLVTHATPELVERHIPLPAFAVAANLVPSADEATLVQYELALAPVRVQVWPRARLAATKLQTTARTVANARGVKAVDAKRSFR